MVLVAGQKQNGEALKRRFRIVLGASVVLLGLGTILSYTNVLSRKITVSWSYDYSKQPACSENRPRDCVQEFQILDYTNPEKPQLLHTVANPKDAAGKTDQISDEFTYGPPFGMRTIVVVAVARDKDGVVRTSNPYAARKDVEILPKALSHSKGN
jgi:hypothetical protein